MVRSILAATLATAALLGASAAQAGTHWSIGVGINVPPAGVYVDAPRYVEPAPVYYAPPPVVTYAPAPRYYPRDVYYAPPPRVVYETTYRERRWDDRRWDDRRDWRRDDGHRDHGDHGGYGPRRER